MTEPMLPPLSREEMALVALAATLYDGSATVEEMEEVVTWIDEARLNQALLRLVLEGSLALKFVNGELRLRVLTDEERTRRCEGCGETYKLPDLYCRCQKEAEP